MHRAFGVSTGESPDCLSIAVEPRAHGACVHLNNNSEFLVSGIQLTISFYHGDSYLDFQDVDLPDLPASADRKETLDFDLPDACDRVVVDAVGETQTWLRRNWSKLVVVATVVWGVVVLSRRLTGY